jgi:dTDP-4-dehydrorhamnose 3,5-epimerase
VTTGAQITLSILELDAQMIVHATKLQGVFEIQPEPTYDERGFFARTWCREEFKRHGLDSKLVQCSVSYNVKKGTLRGMHLQDSPYAEVKLVRCTRGAIYDVVVDLRISSPTFREWIGMTLTASKRNMAYVAEGCAHGFLTLEDDTEVFYQMSEYYHPEASKGVRWNDPAFGVVWPGEVAVISERDRTLPDFEYK